MFIFRPNIYSINSRQLAGVMQAFGIGFPKEIMENFPADISQHFVEIEDQAAAGAVCFINRHFRVSAPSRPPEPAKGVRCVKLVFLPWLPLRNWHSFPSPNTPVRPPEPIAFWVQNRPSFQRFLWSNSPPLSEPHAFL